MTATLQREHWNGQPTYLGDLFRVSRCGVRSSSQPSANSGRIIWDGRYAWTSTATFSDPKCSAHRMKC